ncbi:MAG: putative transcriptional regulator, TetR family [Anaerocolumna sp.]|nr:putative transcriptional regulator, TetR family [Anaerocolumna sp.]
MEKENQRIKLTKTLLKNSLIELMHKKPITKITIKELCENAGINRSTFYLYYTDQFALLHEIEQELLLQSENHIKKIGTNLAGISYLQELLHYMKDNSDIFRTLLCHQDNLPFQNAFIEATIKYLKINVSLQCSEKISAYLYSYLTMGALSLIRKWIESDFDLTENELATLIFHISDKTVSIYN